MDILKQVEKNDYKTIFKILTFKHEVFTHIVPVPAAIYYSIITLHKVNPITIGTLIVSGITSATIMLIIGTFLRFIRIKNIFYHLIPVENYYIKNKLLLFPYFEVILIMCRWILGITFAHILFSLSLYYFTREFDFRFHITAIPLALFIIPIEMTGHYLITENEIRKYIQSTKLKDIAIIQPNKKFRITILLKILFFIFSLVNMPIILLLSMNYLSSRESGLQNPLFHMIIITILLLYPLFQISYYLAKNIKVNLNQIRKSLYEVSTGNFEQKVGMLTYDEFGELAIYINKIIEKLKEMYYSLINLNKNLEKKVEERTNALEESLIEIQKLKNQQDADYFLTTLLLKPFFHSKIENEKINQIFEYDFFIEQKKKFIFKNKQEEIGGDYCCFEEIILKDKTYLFFINADAMGKSIQGAGGILVLGSMIQYAIQRNKFFKEDQQLSPEHWLRELFIQMHKTLETFQGTMYISCIIGLIDIETLSLYYMNAEHPNPILIRNKEAFFLYPNNNLLKLGLSIEKKHLFIHSYQLKKDDILFIGSDGKDDLELPNGEINDNEFLFIDIINQSDHSLNAIYQILTTYGKIKDDFSLMKIKVKEKSPLENEEFIEELSYIKEECLKIISNYNLNKEEYQKIYDYLKYYISIVPLDNKMLSIYAQICFKLNKFNEALENIERLLLREPENSSYILIASKFYEKLEKTKFRENIPSYILSLLNKNK
jgi:serine phosphatase RsbU (regulator of sigma subunit)